MLKACASAMSGLADRLPDTSFDPALRQSLHESILALPDVSLPEETPVEAASEDGSGQNPVATDPEVGSAPDMIAADVMLPVDGVDHYADSDPELFEIFLEEAVITSYSIHYTKLYER